MGFILFPLVVLTFFVGAIAIQQSRFQDSVPPSTTISSIISGQTFLAYRDAVAVYQKNHPTFTGIVSAADLAAQGSQFSQSFLAGAGNAITAAGVSARVITCFAALPAGAISAAVDASLGDASLGIASGSSWTSVASGSSATALATSVPSGNVVSVVQIGN